MEMKTYLEVFEKIVDNIDKVAYPCLVSESVHPNVKADVSHPEAVSWLKKLLRYGVPTYSQFR